MRIDMYRNYKFFLLDKDGNREEHIGEVQFVTDMGSEEETYLIKAEDGYRYMVPKSNIEYRTI